jgi:hypothetical protein
VPLARCYTTAGTAITVAQALISGHVDAIVDVSETDTVWASAVQAADIPVIGVKANDEPSFTNPDFYPLGETGNSAMHISPRSRRRVVPRFETWSASTQPHVA